MHSLAARSFATRQLRSVWPLVRYSTPRKYSSTVHDKDAELLEREKRRNLSGEGHKTSTLIEDAPGWNEDLATTSEAHIKADRSTMSTENLQAKTVRHLQARDDADDWPNARGAMYVRDEVIGPLGSANVGDVERAVDSEGDGQPVVRIVHEDKMEVKKQS